MTTSDNSSFAFICSAFSDNLCWGKDFVASQECLREIENAASSHQIRPSALGGLRESIAKVHSDLTAGFKEIKESVAEMHMQQQKTDYLEMVNIAKEPPVPAPFDSIAAAERFLSESPENMDVLKSLFGNSQAVLQALQKNSKIKESRKGQKVLPLQSRVLWEFLFTKPVLNSLYSRTTFDSLGPATLDFLADRGRFLSAAPFNTPDAAIMVKLRHHLTFRKRYQPSRHKGAKKEKK